MKNIRLHLQMFGENEPKTFTQEELNQIIQERLSREDEKHKKELEDLKFEMSKQGKDKDEQTKLDLEKQKSINNQLQEEIALLQKERRIGQVISTYANDKLPCQSEFTTISHLIADIDDDSKRAEMYEAFKKYVIAVKTELTNESLKQKSPNGSANLNGNNPFVKDINQTDLCIRARNNPDETKKLLMEAGKYEEYKFLFE